MKDIEKHLFDDTNFFPDKMKTLILGTFPVPLYSSKEKFYSLSEDKRENSWYYSSVKSEFWKLIADSFEIKDRAEFMQNKSIKKKLFQDNNIGIADVFSKCKRKDKNGSKDTDLIVVEYNDSLIKIFNQYSKSLKLIIFTSRFTENNFFKILKANNLNDELKESVNKKLKNALDENIINSVRERHLFVNDIKIKIATVTLKISPIRKNKFTSAAGLNY